MKSIINKAILSGVTLCSNEFPKGAFLRNSLRSAAVAVAILPLAVSAATYYVDAENGNDSADGSEGHPRKSLVKVMELVTPDNGDIVLAAPGAYSNETCTVGDYTYRVKIPAGTTLKAAGRRENTFIVGAADDDVGGSYGTAPYGCGPKSVRCGYLEANARIEGFTITGGRDSTETSSSAVNPGGLLGAAKATCFAYNCIFSNNVTKCRGAALGNVTSVGCYFANNRAGEGNADAFQMCDAYNCVFGPTVKYHAYFQCNFFNCTFLFKTARQGCKVYNSLILAQDNDGKNYYYNCLYTALHSSAVPDDKCRQVELSEVPYNPATYMPLPGSAAIDAGDDSYVKPTVETAYADYLGNSRVYGSSVDVGAVEKRASVDWYVDAVNGDDANDGDAPNRARRTLAAAMSIPRLEPGDIVNAAAGTYDEGEVYRNEGDNNHCGTNRVVVAAGVGLVATNAAVTFIKGHLDGTSSSIGSASVRCVFLEDGAWIENFTITNGFARGKWSGEGYGGGVCSVGGAAVGCRIIGCGAVSEGRLAYGGTYIRCYIEDSLSYSNKEVQYADAVVNCVVAKGVNVGNTPVVLNSSILGNVANSTLYNSYAYYDGGNSHFRNCRLYYAISGNGSDKDESTIDNIKTQPVLDSDYRPALDDDKYCDKGDRLLYDANFPSAWVRFKDRDFAGGQRIYNAAIDIGAGEADWRETYTAALGAKRTTVAEAGPGVTAGMMALDMADGDTLVLRVDLKATGNISMKIVTAGTATVTCGGQTAEKSGDVYIVRKVPQGLADVTIVATGSTAVVSDVAGESLSGFAVIVR